MYEYVQYRYRTDREYSDNIRTSCIQNTIMKGNNFLNNLWHGKTNITAMVVLIKYAWLVSHMIEWTHGSQCPCHLHTDKYQPIPMPKRNARVLYVSLHVAALRRVYTNERPDCVRSWFIYIPQYSGRGDVPFNGIAVFRSLLQMMFTIHSFIHSTICAMYRDETVYNVRRHHYPRLVARHRHEAAFMHTEQKRSIELPRQPIDSRLTILNIWPDQPRPGHRRVPLPLTLFHYHHTYLKTFMRKSPASHCSNIYQNIRLHSSLFNIIFC